VRLFVLLDKKETEKLKLKSTTEASFTRGCTVLWNTKNKDSDFSSQIQR
jgi:hypothetical protein